MVIRARKSGATFVSEIVSLLPFALIPVAVVALPSMTACAPLMSPMKSIAGETIFGLRSRFIAYAKLAADTAEPSANLKPLLTVKVYVLPSRDTAGRDVAASGTILVPPAAASLSGKLSSLHDVAYCICQPCEK